MVTVALAMQKGGVGKTTATINLAAALARANKSVLIVDLDPQGSLTQYFFPNLTSLPFTMYNILIERKFLSPLELGDLIGLLPSNIDLAAADITLPTLTNSDKRLYMELRKYTNYDFCLIDCPPSLGHLTKNGLTASNFILIPVETELMAERAIPLIMNTINDVIESELNPDLKVWHICQVPESLHTKIRVNKGESVTDVPRRTDWESDSPDSHEAALDCKS